MSRRPLEIMSKNPEDYHITVSLPLRITLIPFDQQRQGFSAMQYSFDSRYPGSLDINYVPVEIDPELQINVSFGINDELLR